MTTWTVHRLQLLFQRYNQKYWKDKLPECEIVIVRRAVEYCGRLMFKDRKIEIGIRNHSSDHEVRSTLLHEMAHFAAGKPGHGSPFFSQLERLLRLKAPIEMGFPENPKRILLESIPKRFHLCRKAFAPAYARRNREEERAAKREGISGYDLPVEEVAVAFGDAAFVYNLTWKRALKVMGERYHLLDIDGKVLKWAEPFVKAGRKAHRKWRQLYLIGKKAAASW